MPQKTFLRNPISGYIVNNLELAKGNKIYTT